jgi:hypothetical protein
LLINSQQCDPPGPEGLLPLGKVPKLTLNCDTTFERTASRDGRFPDVTEHDSVSLEIAYSGDGWVTVPSGNWQVHKLSIKTTPKGPNHRESETEILFSTELGATVRNHTIGTNPAAQSTTETTIELVSVSP